MFSWCVCHGAPLLCAIDTCVKGMSTTLRVVCQGDVHVDIGNVLCVKGMATCVKGKSMFSHGAFFMVPPPALHGAILMVHGALYSGTVPFIVALCHL